MKQLLLVIKKAIAIQPDNVNGYISLGTTFKKLGKIKEAKQVFLPRNQYRSRPT